MSRSLGILGLVAAASCGIAILVAGLPGKIAVPTEQPTIQQAIDVAQEGDVITVQAGTYLERLVLDHVTGVTIKGVGKVVIDAGATGNALKMTKCTDVVLKGLHFTNSASHAVYVYNSLGPTIEHCEVSGAKGDGIRLEYTLGSRIANNEIHDVAGNGIKDAIGGFAPIPADDEIVHNDVHDVGSTGIILTGAVHHVVRANRVLRSGAAGISVDSTECEIRANKVRSTTGDGIAVKGHGHFVVKNDVRHAGADGLHTECANLRCAKNRVTGSIDDGVDVRGTESDFAKNVVKKSGDNGFEMNAAPNEVVKNRATGSDAYDLLDVSTGDNVYLRNVFPRVGP